MRCRLLTLPETLLWALPGNPALRGTWPAFGEIALAVSETVNIRLRNHHFTRFRWNLAVFRRRQLSLGPKRHGCRSQFWP